MNDSSDFIAPLEVYKAINHTEIFSGIGAEEQHALASKLFRVERPEKEIIIEQGDISDNLYMIMRGYVLVFKKTTDGWARINRLGPGDVFGEIGVVRRVRRTARIVTETSCTFLCINARDFLDIYQYFPPKARDNIQIFIAKRLAHLSHTTD